MKSYPCLFMSWMCWSRKMFHFGWIRQAPVCTEYFYYYRYYFQLLFKWLSFGELLQFKPCLTKEDLWNIWRRLPVASQQHQSTEGTHTLWLQIYILIITVHITLVPLCWFKSLYIKENRTPLSPRRPLIGSSRDFTREHGSSQAWKWSRSNVDCGFLIKVTRENSVNVSNLFIVLSGLYTEGSVVASAANVIGCG